MDILKKIQPIFCEIFEDDDLIITRETKADDIEDWDSFAQMQIVMELEEMFHIKFTTSELELWKNVGDVIDTIEKHIK